MAITDKGKQVMEELYPRFHVGEVDIVAHMSVEEQKNMSSLLRNVIRKNNF